MSTFVAKLRALAASCNFGDTLDVMLRDQIVCGINDTAMQKRLLAETKLKCKQVLEIARGLERAARNIKELKLLHVPEMMSPPEVHKTASTEKFKAEVVCFHCGKPGHYVSKCRVNKAVTCHQCRKAGHLRKACKSDRKAKGREQRARSGAVRRVVEQVEEKEVEVPILHVRACKKSPPYLVTVEADGVDLQMEVDTGSSVSLVSQVTFRKLWPDRKLTQCKYRLRSYSEVDHGAGLCGGGGAV